MDSFIDNEPLEGAVVKGTVVAIEKDLAIIDVGLKTEGPPFPKWKCRRASARSKR